MLENCKNETDAQLTKERLLRQKYTLCASICGRASIGFFLLFWVIALFEWNELSNSPYQTRSHDSFSTFIGNQITSYSPDKATTYVKALWLLSLATSYGSSWAC